MTACPAMRQRRSCDLAKIALVRHRNPPVPVALALIGEKVKVSLQAPSKLFIETAAIVGRKVVDESYAKAHNGPDRNGGYDAYLDAESGRYSLPSASVRRKYCRSREGMRVGTSGALGQVDTHFDTLLVSTIEVLL